MSKKSILGQSYGGLKNGVAKLAKIPWRLPCLNKIQKFLRPSDRELHGDYFGLWNFWKRSFLAWVMDNQSLVPNRDTFCPVFTPIRHFLWLSLFSLPVCTFLVISFQTPPSKIWDSILWGEEPTALLTPHRPMSWIFSGKIYIINCKVITILPYRLKSKFEWKSNSSWSSHVEYLNLLGIILSGPRGFGD